MNSRRPAFAIRSPLMRQLPRRSSASQPYTAGTSGHLAIARATIASIGPLRRQREEVDRMRLRNAEALGQGDAHRLQPQQDVLLLHALAHHAKAEALADAQNGGQLVARRV